MALANIQKAHYAKKTFKENGFEIAFDGHSFNEFVVKLNKPVKAVNQLLLEKGIIGGYDLGRDYPGLENHMLVAVTELRTKEEIDTFVKEMGDINA
jgi:glycine dehydrogenase subunit 1